jgi:membrane-associated phospholipid phosphatase
MAFAGARLSNRNLDAIDMHRTLRSTLQSVNLAAAATVGWARVEGERHYPADALAGAALGDFLAVFVHDALIGTPREEVVVGLEIEPAHGGIRCALSWEF